jgi:hypothetical protein
VLCFFGSREQNFPRFGNSTNTHGDSFFGTSSSFSKNREFAFVVDDASWTSDVLPSNTLPGSLNPIWPFSPIPSTCTSTLQGFESNLHTFSLPLPDLLHHHAADGLYLSTFYKGGRPPLFHPIKVPSESFFHIRPLLFEIKYIQLSISTKNFNSYFYFCSNASVVNFFQQIKNSC